MKCRLLSAIAISCVVGDVSTGQADRNGLSSLTVLDHGTHQCVPEATRAYIEDQIALYRATHEPHPAPEAVALYPFFPQGGTQNEDLLFTNFVDVNPAGGALQDFLCGDVTYDGHWGHDNIIATWEDQVLGVPVYAALDGTVMFTNDGEFDMNTSCNGSGNYVIIDHGGGREGWYFHLKNGSVAVTPGSTVKMGQQIGLTASSGCSTYPHLHFESRQNGVFYEPFAGSCRVGASGWLNQPAIDYAAGIYDFWVATVHPSATGNLPNKPTHEAQITYTKTLAYFTPFFTYLPAQSNWRVQIERPNGTIALDSGVVQFNNATLFRSPWGVWQYNTFFFEKIAGTWIFHMDINGKRVIDAPVEVVQNVTPGFNRAPEAITGSFEPSVPDAARELTCRVKHASVIDDKDWDTVRYHYVWKINGATVRDVVTSARSDVIPVGLGMAGQSVECTVTPSDGKANGGVIVVAGAFAGACYADCDGSGSLDFFDFLCFQNEFAAGATYADCDGSGSLDFFDFLCFQNEFAAGCP